MKKLPIGIQTLSKIIENDYIYIDKTRYVYDLITGNKYNFLSRPRRFGKSLLIDTIAEVYNGNKELFAGLHIYNSDYSFKKFPIIRIDMSNMATDTPDILKTSIMSYLDMIYTTEELKRNVTIESDAFRNLIMMLHNKHKERIVILIDEYDKPILDHMTDTDIAAANRNVLKGFYGILKSMDPYLEFVMMTGVSKFTKTSVFSELNNMSDITMKVECANICGITIEEFDEYFAEHIKSLSSVTRLQSSNDIRSDILRWYDGYSWDGETRVFNPFSLLNFFDQKMFGSFWYNSGTPSFLVGRIKKDPESYANINEVSITSDMLGSGDINSISIASLLFQTGYLTVKEVSYPGGQPVYTLGMPNLEVKQAFNLHVISALTENDDVKTRTLSIELGEALQIGDMQKVLTALRRLFSSIPYEIHINQEAYYHSIFYALMSFTGLGASAEVSVSDGRVDVILEYDDIVHIMEFKYEDIAKEMPEEEKRKLFGKILLEGLDQIDKKGYCKPYIGSGKTIYKTALAFLGRSDIELKYEKI